MKKVIKLSAILFISISILGGCKLIRFKSPICPSTRVYDNIRGVNHDSSDVVNFLIIHGIGNKPRNYASVFIHHMCKQLNLEEKDTIMKKLVPFLTSASKGAIYYIEHKSKNPNSKTKSYRFYVVHWSPINLPFKEHLKNFDIDGRRSCLSKNLKEKLVLSNFSDVIAYSDSVHNSDIKTIVEQAFLQVFKEEPLSPNSTIRAINSLHVISGSFGSKIVLDVFYENSIWIKKLACSSSLKPAKLTQSEIDDTTFLFNLNPQFRKYIELFFIARNMDFYMLSNQLPLFSVIDYKSSGNNLICDLPNNAVSNSFNEFSKNIQLISESRGDEYFKSINKIQKANNFEELKFNDKWNITIFNDPNDILGFRVTKESLDDTKFSIANVSMYNSLRFLGISNPIRAHENAFTNRYLHKIVAHGHLQKKKKKWYTKTNSM